MQKQRILITGAVSLLGKYLVKMLHSDFELILTSHRTVPNYCFKPYKSHFVHLDIISKNRVDRLVKLVKPQYLIHLAAVSQIDYCEHYPHLSKKVNVGGTVNICKSLTNSSTHLIFTSSNAVFDGSAAPYRETDLPRPLNVYGQTKYQAERAVLKGNFPHSIVRLSTMFGWQPKGARPNDVTFYLKKLNQKIPLKLVDDRFFNPIYALRAADAIRQIIAQKFTGIIHVAGHDRVNRYFFVNAIRDIFSIRDHPPIVPVTNDFFQNLAPRPYDSTLSIRKMKQMLKVTPKSLPVELRHVRNTVF